MKKTLLFSLLFCFTAPLFAVDTITVDRPTNIFNTEVEVASTTMRSVRIGKVSNVPTVSFNQPGYAPMRLQAVNGLLYYNGVTITTNAFAGTDMAVTNDLAVGRDSAVTRNETVGGTLVVTGAAAAATMNTGQGAYELFKMDQNADTTASPSFVAASITGGALQVYSRSMAQLLSVTPSAVGRVYFCSDCTPAKLVVSTGTSAGNFADPAGGTFK